MKLLLLDKDGTLTRPKSGETFVPHPEDQELIPGVAEALQRYRDEGWRMAIVTNQGGVAAGHKTLQNAIAETIYACKLTGIHSALLCPSAAGEVGDDLVSIGKVDGNWRSAEYTLESWEQATGFAIEGFRKPMPGMLQAAIELSVLSVDKVLMVGDRLEDEGAAKLTDVDFMWADEWLQK